MKQICDGNLFLYAYSFLWFIEIEIEYMYTWKVYFHIVLLFVVSQMHLCIKSIFMDILSGNWFIRTNEIYLLKNILSDYSCKLLLFMNQVFFFYLWTISFLQIICKWYLHLYKSYVFQSLYTFFFQIYIHNLLI